MIVAKKEPITNSSLLHLSMHVFHEKIYGGRELMTVVGIRKDQVELRGDYSGGTNPSVTDGWHPIEGTFRLRKVCEEHLKNDGNCPLPNIHCGYPNCEPYLSNWGHYVEGKLTDEVVLNQ